MRKIAIVAFAFVLSATMLAGCRGGSSTDMTTISTESTGNTGTSMPSEGGARGRAGGNRDNMIQDGNAQGRIDRQCN